MSKPVAIGLAIVSLAILGYQLFGGSPANSSVDGIEGLQTVTLSCSACNKTFDLTPEDYETAMNPPARQKNDKVTCTLCGEKSAWRGTIAMEEKPVDGEFTPNRQRKSDLKPTARVTEALVHD